MPLALDALANLCLLFAVILTIRTAAWTTEVVRVGFTDGVHISRAMMNERRYFGQWIIRAGTVLLAVLAIGLWTKSPLGSLAAMIALSALLGWRWIHYAQRNSHALLSMALLAIVSIAMAASQGVQP